MAAFGDSVVTPDGRNGIVAKSFPQETYIRIPTVSGNGMKKAEVTPVQMDDGEVRFYRTDVVDAWP